MTITERRAAAFHAIESGRVSVYYLHLPDCWVVETTSGPLRAVASPDLLTAIEKAMAPNKPCLPHPTRSTPKGDDSHDPQHTDEH